MKPAGTATAAFNAANEIAVKRFLAGEIEFLHIESIIEQVLQRHEIVAHPDLDEILAADTWARKIASTIKV